ncbi:putative F-box protein At5g50220 [Nymphaea colorata]|nr:putative F-box protein At5g50220 [Nymphaea colorata]
MGGAKRSKGLVNLPLDILSNILSRLPATSLIRFALNISLYKNPLECDLVVGKPVDAIDPPLDLSEGSHNLVSSLDGLLLYRDTGARSNSPWTLYVYNPATRETVILPRLRRSGPFTVHQLVFDPAAKVYKVLHVPDVQSKETCSQIFTLSVDKQWRKSNGSRSDFSATSYSKALEYPLVNGAIHWARDCGWGGFPYPGYAITRRTIVAFKVGSEEFQIFSHPNCCPAVHPGTYREIGECHRESAPLIEINGFMHLMHPDATKQTMDVWVLKDYDGQVWEKDYSVSMNFIDETLPTGVTLSFRAKLDGEILLEQHAHFVHRRTNLASTSYLFYNPTLRTFQRLQNIQGGLAP